MFLGAGESSTQAWVVISLAIIGAISAIGAAWASNRNRGQIKTMTASNSSDHERVVLGLKDVVERQQWVITQLGEIRQALLQHVVWEEGNHNAPGKYDELQRQMNLLEAELAKMRKSPPAHRS